MFALKETLFHEHWVWDWIYVEIN